MNLFDFKSPDAIRSEEIEAMSQNIARAFYMDVDRWMASEIRAEFERCRFTLECSDRDLAETIVLLGWSILVIDNPDGSREFGLVRGDGQMIARRKVDLFRQFRALERRIYFEAA